jgi:hypothetical protein
MDDSRVTQVGLQTVMRQNAYLLFYVKTVKPLPVPPPKPKLELELEPEAAATSTPTKAAAGKAGEEEGLQQPKAQPRRPETPGWSDVLAKLREENAKEEDHTKDLKPPGGTGDGEALVDTSWSQPEVVADCAMRVA